MLSITMIIYNIFNNILNTISYKSIFHKQYRCGKRMSHLLRDEKNILSQSKNAALLSRCFRKWLDSSIASWESQLSWGIPARISFTKTSTADIY